MAMPDKGNLVFLLLFYVGFYASESGGLGGDGSDKAKVELLCTADSTWSQPTPAWGYAVSSLPLPDTRRMRVDIMLSTQYTRTPVSAKSVEPRCCHNVHMRFDLNGITDVFVPLLDWTQCAGYVERFQCRGTRRPDLTGPPVIDVWAMNLRQCIFDDYILYEFIIFPQDFSQNSYRIIGKANFIRFNRNSMQRFKQLSPLGSPPLVCVLSGKISVHGDQTWHGPLDTFHVMPGTSIVFEFLFSLTQPANSEILSAIIYSNDLPRALAEKLQCSEIYSPTDALTQNNRSHQRLSLALTNIWAGCSVSNVDGKPRYTCRGGVNFRHSATIHFGISNCKQFSGISITYKLALLGASGVCSGTEEALPQSRAKSRARATNNSPSQSHPWIVSVISALSLNVLKHSQ